jgi:hypothetical protein
MRQNIQASNHKVLKPIIDIIQLDENSNMELSNDFQKCMRSKGKEVQVSTPSQKKRNSGYVFGPNSVYGRNAAYNNGQNQSMMSLFDPDDSLQQEIKQEILESVQKSRKKVFNQIEDHVKEKLSKLRRETAKIIMEDDEEFDNMFSDLDNIENMNIYN